jgi:hypothetical protein
MLLEAIFDENTVRYLRPTEEVYVTSLYCFISYTFIVTNNANSKKRINQGGWTLVPNLWNSGLVCEILVENSEKLVNNKKSCKYFKLLSNQNAHKYNKSSSSCTDWYYSGFIITIRHLFRKNGEGGYLIQWRFPRSAC